MTADNLFTPTVLLLRSKSGAGKNTFADYIKEIYDWGHWMYVEFGGRSGKSNRVSICSADDHFLNEKGEYNFKADELGKAHGKCRRKFHEALEDKVDLVIVNNTNTDPKEFGYYVDCANEFGYRLFSIVIENRHGGQSVHSVPEQTLKRQEERLRNSLKL